MDTMRWQDWVELALGMWLVVSPVVLGFEQLPLASWNAVILGAAIIAFALAELGLPKLWEEALLQIKWVNLGDESPESPVE